MLLLTRWHRLLTVAIAQHRLAGLERSSRRSVTSLATTSLGSCTLNLASKDRPSSSIRSSSDHEVRPSSHNSSTISYYDNKERCRQRHLSRRLNRRNHERRATSISYSESAKKIIEPLQSQRTAVLAYTKSSASCIESNRNISNLYDCEPDTNLHATKAILKDCDGFSELANPERLVDSRNDTGVWMGHDIGPAPAGLLSGWPSGSGRLETFFSSQSSRWRHGFDQLANWTRPDSNQLAASVNQAWKTSSSWVEPWKHGAPDKSEVEIATEGIGKVPVGAELEPKGSLQGDQRSLGNIATKFSVLSPRKTNVLNPSRLHPALHE
ncbi:unnamed protein product [Protopolystoma xenopodis]|uniref:Uncharacterized protein n=1 Tax=Protopolystoma xenopodis TaxID=117903 RepID=A0A448WM14_9PLAT|nr:unnamed protein product [Protopolystoma xenopodis]